MGGAASVESIWASERVRNEYERYCRQVAEGTEEDLGYDLDPLDDASAGARFDIMFRSLLQEKDKVISESVGLHPVTWVSKYNEMSEEQKGEYCKAVVESQLLLGYCTVPTVPYTYSTRWHMRYGNPNRTEHSARPRLGVYTVHCMRFL